MKSYRLRQFTQPLEVETQATPEPAGSEVLLKVLAAGVCHTDLHLCDGGYDLGHGKQLLFSARGVKLPLTPGHETVGTVLATGPEANGTEPGHTCLIFPWIGCGECFTCQAGDERFCDTPRFLGVLRDGGYADHILVPHPRCLVNLEGLDPVAAAPYACAGVTTYGALKKLGEVIYHEPVVVVGAGGLGLMCLRLLRAMEAVGAVVSDVDEQKREAALSAGALCAVDANAPEAAGQLARAAGGSVRAVIDFVGSQQSAALAFNCLAKGGRIVMVGLFGGAAPWSLPLITLKAATIQGNYLGRLDELQGKF